jgi:hypothetical protein
MSALLETLIWWRCQQTHTDGEREKEAFDVDQVLVSDLIAME